MVLIWRCLLQQCRRKHSTTACLHHLPCSSIDLILQLISMDSMRCGGDSRSSKVWLALRMLWGLQTGVHHHCDPNAVERFYAFMLTANSYETSLAALTTGEIDWGLLHSILCCIIISCWGKKLTMMTEEGNQGTYTYTFYVPWRQRGGRSILLCILRHRRNWWHQIDAMWWLWSREILQRWVSANS